MCPRRQRSARGSGDRLRDEILTATRELIARSGDAAAVSIRDVGRMVGVTAPSIYRHFADKGALIDAAVAQAFENLDAALAEATDHTTSPITRMRDQGLAYVRFALEHPAQYRVAMASTADNHPRAVDQVMTSGAFQRFAQSVRDALDAGAIPPGDPLPVVLELWSAAHGIASLLIAKPFLPWGEAEAMANRVLGSVCVGHAVIDRLGGEVPEPDDLVAWLPKLPPLD